MFADDTKCHSALQHPDDNKILQSDLDKIRVWCHDWKMSLNQCKCGVVHFSRSQQPKPSQYTLLGKPIKPTCSQKDLGIITTSDLKWKKKILEMSSKTNRMLGSVKQTALLYTNRQSSPFHLFHWWRALHVRLTTLDCLPRISARGR